MKYLIKNPSFQTGLRLVPLGIFFLLQGIEFTKAQEGEKEDKNPKVILFDSSKETDESLGVMHLAFSRSAKKSSVLRNNGDNGDISDEEVIIFKERVIYLKKGSSGTFRAGPFSEKIPPEANLCLEGVLKISQNLENESIDNPGGGFRLGFKLPSGNAISLLLYNATAKPTRMSLMARVFSGPRIAASDKEKELGDERVNEMIYSSSLKEFSINNQDPLHFRIIAHGTTSEISLWINGRSIFKKKSAYKGVIGQLCPLDFIDGFYLRFEQQNNIETVNPASAGSIICYYTLDQG